MNNRVYKRIAYIGAFVAAAPFVPWTSQSDSRFESGGLRALVIAIVVYVVIRYGTPLALRLKGARSDSEHGNAPAPGVSCWRHLKFALSASLAIGLLSVVFAENRVVPVDAAHWTYLIGQQLLLIATIYSLIRKPIDTGSRVWAIASFVSLALMAVFFAWSSDIVYQAATPRSMSVNPDSVDVLFSIPVLLASMFGIARTLISK